jgi:hypothetical protein
MTAGFCSRASRTSWMEVLLRPDGFEPRNG